MKNNYTTQSLKICGNLWKSVGQNTTQSLKICGNLWKSVGENNTIPKNLWKSVKICGTIFLTLFSLYANAQENTTLQNAIAIAVKNNASLKNEQLKTELSSQLIKTYKPIANTNLGFNIGQINSIYIDNQVFASQTLSLPKVYNATKSLYTQAYLNALNGITLKEIDLKKAVTENFYHQIYLAEKEKILLKMDTIYTEFLRKATLRLQKGETNVVEKASAEIQKTNIQIQLNNLDEEKKVAQLTFQYLLNTQTIYAIKSASLLMSDASILDTVSVQKHPMLVQLQQQIETAKYSTALEKTKLLPEFSIGANTGTIKGVGANEKIYNGSYRFQQVQVGVALPIFNKAQKEKIKAYTLHENIAQKEYETKEIEFKNEVIVLLQKHNTLKQNLAFYTNNLLPNAAIISTTANSQFVNGEINYLEWTQLMHQTIQVETNYIETIKLYNDNLIGLQYLLNNPKN